MIDSSVFYDFGKVLSRNAAWNFIAGGRGIGKTYGAKKRALKRGITLGKQFIYVRRYKEELNSAAQTFFADIQHEFPNVQFRRLGKHAQYTKDIDKEDDKKKWRTIGFFVALSVSATLKSVSYPDVETIIYDEFIAEKGRRYLPDEYDAFMNFYLTVDRYRDALKGEMNVRVLFLANSVSVMNPYFLQLEIYPDQCGEWWSSSDGFAAAHFPDSDDFKNVAMGSRLGRFIEGTEYADYAVGNQFADAHDGLIETKTVKARYQYTLDTDKGAFSVWLDTYVGEYFLQQKRPRKENVFVLKPDRMRDNTRLLIKSDFRLKILRESFKRGMMLFDRPVTRNAFLETMK